MGNREEFGQCCIYFLVDDESLRMAMAIPKKFEIADERSLPLLLEPYLLPSPRFTNFLRVGRNPQIPYYCATENLLKFANYLSMNNYCATEDLLKCGN